MRNFTRNLITEWRKLGLPFAEGVFVVAVSGGADSVALMLALHDLRERKKLENRFVIAHFNHDLRGADGESDAEFVCNLTSKLNLESVYKIQNPKSKIQNQTGNLEQNARLARYDFLFETAENLRAGYVLTAHTRNDQAETFLMNLIRGSGLEGLGGMKTRRSLEPRVENRKAAEEKSAIRNPQSAIQLIRPLLNWATREDAENFCHSREIEYRHDAMNDDLKFSRVRVRKILLPMLKEFNPKIVETLANTAEILRQSAEQISVKSRQTAIAGQRYEKDRQSIAKNREQILELKDLRDVFPAVLRTVLRQWLKNNRGNTRGLQLKHIEAIEKLIFSRKSGKVVELPNGACVLKSGGKLHFQSAKVEKS